MCRVRVAFESQRRALLAALLSGAVTPSSLARMAPPSWTVFELGAEIDAAVSTGALAINDAGVAAGWVGDAPALFTPDGRARRLGERPGRALGFDRDGHVVGRFFGADDGPPVAFVGRGARLVETTSLEAAAMPDEAHMRSRPQLPRAFFAQAYGRNRAGDVVGTSDTGVGSAARAVMQAVQGDAIDLEALPEVRAAGWRQLLVAYAINNRGAIVGVGTRRDGAMRGFLLMPRLR